MRTWSFLRSVRRLLIHCSAGHFAIDFAGLHEDTDRALIESHQNKWGGQYYKLLAERDFFRAVLLPDSDQCRRDGHVDDDPQNINDARDEGVAHDRRIPADAFKN